MRNEKGPACRQAGVTLVVLLILVTIFFGGFILGSIYFHPFSIKKGELLNSSPPAVRPSETAAIKDRLDQDESSKSSTFDKSLGGRLTSLEEQFKQISEKLEKNPASSANIPVTYIPIGSPNETVTAVSWVNFGQINFPIDPSDYPGYKNMQMIGDLRVNAGGVAHARLLNDTDNSPILESEISTSSTTFQSLSSAKFNLPNIKKTYRLQGKSDAGDQIFLQNVKIKVNF